MSFPASIALLAGLLAAAADTPETSDEKKLEGTWTSSSYVLDGKELENPDLKASKLTIEGDRYTVQIGEQTLKATLRLYPEKTPKAIDLTYREEGNEGRTFQGIYKLEDDTFIICRPVRPDGDRPEEFSAPAGSGRFLMVWKRQKT